MTEINLRIKINRNTLFTMSAVVVVTTSLLLLYRDTIKPVPAAETQIPSSALAASNFNVYAPIDPPKGFSLDKQSISSTNAAFVYSYTYDKDKHLAVTVQPRPKNLDTAKFNPDKESQTTIGRAYIVDLETRTTAAVVADDSLILINAPQKISTSVLQQFIDTMRLAK